jgi:hypothetical protein
MVWYTSAVDKFASAMPGRFAFRACLQLIPFFKTFQLCCFLSGRGVSWRAGVHADFFLRWRKGAEMPSYQNLLPPISLASGDVGFSFNNEAFPGSARAGSQFAISSFAGQPDSGTAVRWQTIFGTAPTAVSIVLQAAMADVDAEYQTVDTGAATG